MKKGEFVFRLQIFISFACLVSHLIMNMNAAVRSSARGRGGNYTQLNLTMHINTTAELAKQKKWNKWKLNRIDELRAYAN